MPLNCTLRPAQRVTEIYVQLFPSYLNTQLIGSKEEDRYNPSNRRYTTCDTNPHRRDVAPAASR